MLWKCGVLQSVCQAAAMFAPAFNVSRKAKAPAMDFFEPSPVSAVLSCLVLASFC
jgi:hypothetical protein